jgi:hypothetical protein
MINFSVNGNLFTVRSDISIIESCNFTGIQIPRFCYQESLSIAGNCRMCLVELENSEKLVIACLTTIESDLSLLTNSLAVKKARENVLEILLLNHPLDCPICDQGGECDLQDQTKIFGNFFNKMFSTRRGVEDKKFGSLIKTIMTRCIHCTRCVRYSSEILGTENLGTLNRGNLTEIGNYNSKYIESPISGNVIDLCPVGALTTNSSSYQTRPWELRLTETIDLTDSLTSNIFVNFKESEIIRILPKLNNRNKNIITNVCRFSYDSLLNNRIYEKDNLTQKIWSVILGNFYYEQHTLTKSLILINEQMELKILNQLKFLTYLNNQIKIRSICRYKQYKNFNFFSNDDVENFDNENHHCSIIIGSSNEKENEVLNTKIRLKVLNQNYFVYSTTSKYGLKNSNFFMNLNINEIIFFIEGKLKSLSNFLADYKSCQILISENIKKRISNINYIKNFVKKINSKTNIYDLNLSPNTEGFYFLGIKSLNLKDFLNITSLFLINLNDNIFLRKMLINFTGNIFWFNSHYPNFLDKKIFFVPSNSNFFEGSGFYLNLEQIFQKSQKILNAIIDCNNLQILIKEIFNDKRYKFKYLNFVKEFNSLANYSNINKSFISEKTIIDKKKDFISYYPNKLYFHDITQTDTFIKNSYTINSSILNSRLSSL